MPIQDYFLQLQETGEYDVETSTVMSVNNEIISQKLSGSTDSVSCDEEGVQGYQAFLENCNYVDTCDILSALVKGRDDNEKLHKELKDSCVLFLGLPSNKVEVCCYFLDE